MPLPACNSVFRFTPGCHFPRIFPRLSIVPDRHDDYAVCDLSCLSLPHLRTCSTDTCAGIELFVFLVCGSCFFSFGPGDRRITSHCFFDHRSMVRVHMTVSQPPPFPQAPRSFPLGRRYLSFNGRQPCVSWSVIFSSPRGSASRAASIKVSRQTQNLPSGMHNRRP